MSAILRFFSPHSNHLFARLTADDLTLVSPQFAVAALSQRYVIHAAADEVEHIFFPHDGMISLLAVMQDGKAIETATVGREGVVGAMAGLGLYTSMVRAVVQLPMVCIRVSAARFRHAVNASKAIGWTCMWYIEVLLSQARITAACNSLHPVDAWFCRWLLQSADRAEKHYGDAHPGVSIGDVGRAAHVRDGSRRQAAEGRRHIVLPRRDTDTGSLQIGSVVLGILSVHD